MWYVGLYGWYPCNYTINVTLATSCSCSPNGHGTCNAGSSLCVCDGGWAGVGCDQQTASLSSGVNVPNQQIGINQWNYYFLNAPATTYFQAAVKETSTVGDLWLFVSVTDYPTLLTYDDADQTPGVAIHYVSAQFPVPYTFTYYIGVYGNSFIGTSSTTVTYQLVAWAAPF